MSESSSRSSSTDRVDGATIERAVDAYLERVAAGEEPALDPFAAGLASEAERAAFRVEALASEFLWRIDEGQEVSLDTVLARLVGDEERARLREAVAAAREASRRLPWQLEVGARLGGGRYEITGVLGRGGIGTVYEAFDRELQRPVAIKAVRVDPTRDARELAENLLEESQALARLKSEHIVTVFDVLRDGDRVGVVLDRIPGRSLAEVIASVAEAAREGSSAERLGALRQAVGGEAGCAFERSWYRAVACLVARLAQAVARAHDGGVLHRDLKPQNVIVQPDGEPVLLDFGLAHRLGRERTGERRFQGTPEYLAPEQVAAMETGEDPRTDVYALGLILYELLALERAFPRGKDEPITAVLERIRRRRFTALAEHDRHVPVSLRAICERAMAAKPGERYESMGQLREDLGRYLEDLPPRYAKVPRAHAMRLTARRLVRNPLPAAVLAIVVLFAWGAYEWTRTAGPEINKYWRMPPEGELVEIDGNVVFPGDTLAVTIEGGGVLYAVSVFGRRRPDGTGDLLVRPLSPWPLEEGVAERRTRSGRGYGLHLQGSGKQPVGCGQVYEEDDYPMEGLLLFPCRGEEPALEDWMRELEQQSESAAGSGVAYQAAENMLADLTVRGGDGARGGPPRGGRKPRFKVQGADGPVALSSDLPSPILFQVEGR